ncbi:hypothetical protein L3C95_20220 [Chitinophaga filiformis]|uniref:hypothetical protein n=1 Tax=Chitinophaga filiformis TaxID=104663 RepID=UPI001F1D63AB|nr:hypothetical protein [Chitinophaga filiformis]MCF6405241.1 hypothetical protein [Chitinophaga filiformis]
MKIISFAALWFLLLFVVACNRCKHSVKFVCTAANKGDTAFIYVDGSLVFQETFEKRYFMSLASVGSDVKKYCSSADSIKVRAGFNDNDTVFYLDPKDVKYCYIANSINDSLIIYIHSISRPLIMGCYQ